MGWRRAAAAISLAIVAGCADQADPALEADLADTAEAATDAASTAPTTRAFPPAPSVPAGPLAPEVEEALDRIVARLAGGVLDTEAMTHLANSQDPRLAWLVTDILRFLQGTPDEDVLLATFEALTGVDSADLHHAWRDATDVLIAWDVPSPPGYREHKAGVFVLVEPAWAPIFDDADAAIDWRWLSWGGVLADARPLGDAAPCARGCIPALDDPALTDAAGGDWYDDARIVFGVVVNGDAVAFPEHIMEVHELVNITVGGRRLGIPYCTLCGSAQAYATDSVPFGVETPILRTSGLLSRSNKVMYDLLTSSAFDTFTGRAVSGPLQDRDVVLEQISVVASSWGAWQRDHPETRIVAEDGGIGRDYPDDPLRGRDDGGPIFPIGDVDPRLPVQTEVVGVIDEDGTPVAFPVEQARAMLAAGDAVEHGALTAELAGDGLRVRGSDGGEVVAHPARWFAWSQFHPRTELWNPLGAAR